LSHAWICPRFLAARQKKASARRRSDHFNLEATSIGVRMSGSPSICIAQQMRRTAAALPQVRIRMSLRALLHALPQNHCSILFLCKARYYRHIHALLQRERENISLR
jgi:hypothetical protein